MFQSDELIYIELQKTASSHIASLLPRFFNGKKVGEHNAASPELIASRRYFVSSIRNPWDWHLSLWTFGVNDKGGFRTRLTKGASFRKFLQNPSLRRYSKAKKDAALFREVYKDSADVEAFRTWLKLIYNPENKYLFKENHKAVFDVCGLMSFRYMNLCCQNMEDIPRLKAITSVEDLVKFDKDNCYIDYFIRQEFLESDFCKAIEKVRPPVAS